MWVSRRYSSYDFLALGAALAQGDPRGRSPTMGDGASEEWAAIPPCDGRGGIMFAAAYASAKTRNFRVA
jgi:hypothetical protein